MQKFNSTKRDREFSKIRLKVQELNNVIEEAVKKVGSNSTSIRVLHLSPLRIVFGRYKR